MRGVGTHIRACLLAVVIGHGYAGAASAEIDFGDEQTVLYFSGMDLWRHGAFVHGGLLASPGGLDKDGFTLKLLIGAGRYRYIAGSLGNARVTGHQAVALLLPGWRFQRDRLTLFVYGGLDFQRHELIPNDPANSLRGNHVGLRAGFDLWFEPNTLTMIGGDASMSTVGTSYAARLAFGWRAVGSAYIGPEIGGFSMGDDYRQFRIGLHLTGLRTSDLEWSAALGWALDNDERESIYGRLGLLLRR
jgi:hypothetical protein